MRSNARDVATLETYLRDTRIELWLTHVSCTSCAAKLLLPTCATASPSVPPPCHVSCTVEPPVAYWWRVLSSAQKATAAARCSIEGSKSGR